MDNVYLYTRLYGWEEPVITYFKEAKLWKEVFVSKRFPEDEFFFDERYFTEYLPPKLYDQLYPFLAQFIDMESRTSALSLADYREYNFHEYINLFNIYSNAYYNFYRKNEISLFLTNRAPHLGFDLVAYLVARVMGLKTVFMEQSDFANCFFLYTDHFDFGTFKTAKEVATHQPVAVERKHEKHLPYMEQKTLSSKQKLRRFYGSNPLIRLLSQLRHKTYRGQALYRYDLKRQFKKNRVTYNQPADLKAKFVYFGMHLQPEKTTSAWGGKYTDQVLAVERLSEWVPEGVKIYVKENPIQTYFMRGELFYKRLRNIKNVMLVPNDTNTYDLIKNSLLVSTITGTMGWEAITGGKNALIFGWGAWYRQLPGVFYYEDQPSFQAVTNYQINHQQLVDELNKLLAKTGKGLIFPIPYYKELIPRFSPKENVKNITRSLHRFLYEDH